MGLTEQEIIEAMRYTQKDGLTGETRALTTAELSERLGVRQPTIRRLLAALIETNRAAMVRIPKQRKLDKVWTTVQAYYLTDGSEWPTPASEEAD